MSTGAGRASAVQRAWDRVLDTQGHSEHRGALEAYSRILLKSGTVTAEAAHSEAGRLHADREGLRARLVALAASPAGGSGAAALAAKLLDQLEEQVVAECVIVTD